MSAGPEIRYKPFEYIEELDAFIVNKTFDQLATYLGISEWSSVVWIGRLFTLDSDYGEHWFDNWDLKEEKTAQAEALGLSAYELLVIDPYRFKMKDFGGDGPCHSDAQIKLFWTDVLKSMTLSLELLVAEARNVKRQMEEAELTNDPDYVRDLEQRIQKIYASASARRK